MAERRSRELPRPEDAHRFERDRPVDPAPPLPHWSEHPESADAASVLLYALAGYPGESAHDPVEAIAIRLAEELDALQELAHHAEGADPVASLLFHIVVPKARALAILVGRRG